MRGSRPASFLDGPAPAVASEGCLLLAISTSERACHPEPRRGEGSGCGLPGAQHLAQADPSRRARSARSLRMTAPRGYERPVILSAAGAKDLLIPRAAPGRPPQPPAAVAFPRRAGGPPDTSHRASGYEGPTAALAPRP